MQPQKNAVVIGAGFGGLAAALRLTARGHRTTVIDALAGPGGRGVQFVRKTAGQCFRYDAGPTVLTAPVLFEELFALFGERLADHVDLLPVAPWYRMRRYMSAHSNGRAMCRSRNCRSAACPISRSKRRDTIYAMVAEGDGGVRSNRRD